MTRPARLVVAAVLLGLSVSGPAAPAWQPPTDAQLSAAVTAAHTPRALSFARTNLRRPGQPEPAGIVVANTGIPAYTLSPAFVRDGSGPAARLRYVAVVARTADGRSGTIQSAPVAGRPDSGWQVDSVLSGDDETQLSRQLRPGTVLLNEPQINGWYELGEDGVRLLRASLPQTPVGAFVPLREYQRQVHSRYADKQSAGPVATRPPVRPWWLLGSAAIIVVVAAAFARHRVTARGRSRLGGSTAT
ncbi:hypothetical protein [Amycolatopsis sp. SID8362]|uniref:hypothetical protein n=1 Tax=Amycolatopsis sp. SID8362 TaxID=2690346 RepID=UPI00136ADCA2|nr:hypothetical protein [Amycolatopsis sp. SID8362]NBH12127.1 hypothetical protein [Amycolatopsis sp. SID8362]NED48819.1 hypothetical protein [Amycolatopsis sp. SID8362]